MFGKNMKFGMKDLRKSPSLAVAWILEDGNLPNYAQRKNLMTSMYQFYHALGIDTPIFDKHFDEIVKLSIAERAGEMNEKQRERFDNVNFRKIKNMVSETKDPRLRLLLALYSGEMPPLRGEDWRNLKVIKTKDYDADLLPKNYLLLHDHTLHIGDAKTSHTHGDKDILIPQFIIEEIKHYLNEVGGDILLPDLSSPSLTKLLMKHLGFSVQALRKKYVSQLVKQGMTPEQRIEMTRIMGHTLMTSILDYDKHSSNMMGS